MTDRRDRLEELGSEVASPERPMDAGLFPAGYGRLAELAAWWRAVGGARTGPAAPAALWDGPIEPPADIDEALEWGCQRADRVLAGGADLLLVTGPDRMAARVLAAHLIDLDPVDATGWPAEAGLSDDEWSAEIAVLRDGLHRVNGLRGTPVPLLRALGSAPVAATTAALLRSCARRVPALLDGEAAAAAALLARRVGPPARDWWQVAAVREDPLTGRILRSLRLDPLTTLGIRVEDGTASGVSLALLLAAAALPDRSPPAPGPDDAAGAGSTDGG